MFVGFPGAMRGGDTKRKHLGAARFVKDAFLDSETSCMVLHGVDAFRAFQIAPELREKHGYAELTPALKRKLFALNAKVYSLDPAAPKKYSPAIRSTARAPRTPAPEITRS